MIYRIKISRFSKNLFCIYQKNSHCILEDIELDIEGQCKECIYPDIDLEKLQFLKNKKLGMLFNGNPPL